MLKSEMQHQFWITKKTVQRKLGSKEDEHIISSDAELDAKIEVFKSISATSLQLSKIIDLYQGRLCILSQEECMFGRFLKEAGKRSRTTCVTITNTGKSVSYCGQKRMCVRVPLLRLQHELDVFRLRAITDMQNTITNMERERTEYRAALEWMKSASAELDPDTGRGLHKFRTAQSHVRNSKQHFDGLTMDSIQKIDLLAAARCNMFSHVLVSYMSELRQFAQKINTTYDAISKVVEQKPKYDFCVLKELTQHEEKHEKINEFKSSTLDKDESLFFAEDYVDNNELDVYENNPKDIPSKLCDENSDKSISNSEYIINLYDQNQSNEGKSKECEVLGNISSKIINTKDFSFSGLDPISTTQNNSNGFKSKTILESSQPHGKKKINTNTNVKPNEWIHLFADLDPLENIEAFDLKLSGICKNFQQT